jgi:type VI secretion system protein ImpL
MLDSRDHYDAAEIKAWIHFDLSNNIRREINTAQRESLFAHLDTLFEEQTMPLPIPLDQDLIEATQRVVARMPTEERVYSRLKRKGLGEELQDFTVFSAAGPNSQVVFARKSRAALNDGISGFYTRDGYQRVFVKESLALSAELIDESWILGPYTPAATDSALLMGRVKDLYLDDFARQYENLIFDIELAPFSSPQEAENILRILSDPVNSPLLLLLRAIQEETQLDSPPEIPGAKDETTSAAGKRLEQILGRAKTPAPISSVTRQFNARQVISRQTLRFRDRLSSNGCR